jgi:hypothetical protein
MGIELMGLDCAVIQGFLFGFDWANQPVESIRNLATKCATKFEIGI